MEPVIGIDLGTTNSVVATVEDGVPVVIANRGGYRLTPSIVAVSRNGKRLVGQLAKRQAITNAENTAYASKRLIGRKWSSSQVQEARSRLTYGLTEGPHDDVRVTLAGQPFALPELAAMILTELRLDAEDYLGQPVSKAVITVPAYFNDNQRQATRDAGRIAGLDVLRIINEPTAAAVAYGFGKQVERKVVVVDLGGGTLDVSVMDISNGVFDVIATGGDTYLGGDDFDARLVDWMLRRFQANHRIDLSRDKMALQRLKDAAEQAKIELSSSSQAELSLPFIAMGSGGPLHVQDVISREKLEELTGELVDRCTEIFAHVLRDAELHPNQVDEVVLVGGMTRMPRVQEACRRFFGRDPSRGVHPEEVVALGAAIQARALARDSAEMLLLDVTPHSLGIFIAGGLFSVLIPRNTTVPTSARHIFTTVRDEQPSAKIMVLQGEDPKAEGNELLGEFLLTGLPLRPRGEVEIEVIFDISADGIVSVSARDLQTGMRQSITVTATSGLTDEEVSRMMEQNADYLLAQKTEMQFEETRRETEAILRELEELLPKVRKSVEGSASGGDLVKNAEQTIRRVHDACAGRDAAALLAAKEAIERTLILFRGLVQRLSAR